MRYLYFLVVIYPQYSLFLHLQITIYWIPNVLDGLNQLKLQNLNWLVVPLNSLAQGNFHNSDETPPR
jgi:hypothetical protein